MNILLIDDHPLFRSGIAAVVNELDDKVRFVEAEDVKEGLALLKEGKGYSIILLDLALPGLDGMDGIALLRHAAPATPIVVLSATENTVTIRQAITRGAKGYIPKSSGKNIMLNALRLVLSGGVYLPANILQTDGAVSSNSDSLTPRQADVIQLLAQGRSNKEIADKLELTENTVRTHVAAILKRLGVKNRTEAGVTALAQGLLRD